MDWLLTILLLVVLPMAGLWWWVRKVGGTMNMRASWKVNRSLGDYGPFVIQLAISSQPGTAFRGSLPQHRNFTTRKEAEAVRKTLPKPFVRHGIVIDGITVAGVAY